MRRSVALVPGGFVKKHDKGRHYWYYQKKQPDGKVQQVFVGPDDAKTRALIDRHGAADATQGQAALQKLAQATIALGCSEIPLKHGRVIGRLLDHGFFNAGGLLVGTHAFLAYQNMFGVRWDAGAFTVDLDFAHAGKNISLAIARNVQVDTAKAIDSLEMGFIPVMSGTTYKKPDEPDFDLDFLTTFGRSGDAPQFVPALNLSMQPLKFMEFSLEAPMKATLLYRNGPLVVNIPRPERYVWHKLIVYGERPREQRTKANKDLIQAACLLDYLLENDGDLVRESWANASSRGPGWNQRLRQGWDALNAKFAAQRFIERLGV
ncbi:hypothetical protein DIC66_14730 [Rhodoferax lacus]|uniref:Nucleotidyltransferase-like domain-containing protein n=2 Tax=Rhodoferax lacus TaxID=2184758 RepID=A0A3E1RA80_9BURK|nr:hypothetical protein DIC66_14730 [Rhodoferax lacus]